MELIKPIAITKQSFDATINETFYFLSDGGIQVVKNRLTIVNNDTNEIVFQNIKESFNFEQVVDGDTLENGKQYYYYFNTYDIDDNISENSNSVFFVCYNTPIVLLTNLDSGDTLNASNYNFAFSYTQEQDRPINYANITLYDVNNNIVSESDTIRTLQVPTTIEHNFGGMENNSSYKIQLNGVTQDGMVFSSEMILFSVIYIYPTLYSQLDLENKCNDGYTQVGSNLVVVEGIITPEPAIYEYKNDVLKYGVVVSDDSNVLFNGGFNIYESFVMTMDLSISALDKFCVFGTETDGFVFKLNRLVPYGQTELKDFVELYGYENGEKKVYLRSNYIEPINGNCVIHMFLKKIGNNYTLQISVTYREDSVLEWNGNSNVQYFALTNLSWEDESYASETEQYTEIINEMDIFPIDTINLYNGIFYDFRMTNDTSITSSDIIEWNYYTILICEFEQSLYGGNISFSLDNVKYLKIKKRELGNYNWISVYQRIIETEEDFTFLWEDYLEPNNTEIEYALIPILSDGTEGDYITNSILTNYNGVFIIDSNKSYKLDTNVLFVNGQSVQTTGVLYPINAKYPTIINNSANNYQTETMQFTFCGFDFETEKSINKNLINIESNELEQFFKNRKPKIIKGRDNEIKLVTIIGNITKSKNIINNTYLFSINYVTQGEYDVKEDLQKLGFIEVLS